MPKKSKKWLDYSVAETKVRKLKIQSASKWRKFCVSHKIKDIPTHPDREYKKKGWVSWQSWLGTNNKAGSNRKYKINEDYFKEWSRNMAYILGFWWSDGYIDIKRSMFSITQNNKDIDLLLKIKNEMKYGGPLVKHGNNAMDIKIYSKKIVKNIRFLGGQERKSHSILFPKKLPACLTRDFIRGYFDGDGSIYYNTQSKAYMSSVASGSENFIRELFKILQSEIKDLRGNVYRVRQSQNYILSFGVNDTRRLRDYLYSNIKEDNCLCMKRKRDLFFKAGSIRIASQNKIFVPYEEARKIAIQFDIKSSEEWEEKYEKIARDLPSNPDRIYKDKWPGWILFLNNTYLKFQKARLHIRSLGLKNTFDWRQYAKTKRPRNIPSNPWSVYKEWSGMRDWLGIK